MASPPAGKPKWLITGGLGFVGRNVAKYLVDNNLASAVRLVDRRAPFMAFLSPDYKAAILAPDGPVECVQADVADEDMCAAAFAEPRGGGAWDYVVHCAAETDNARRDEFHAKTVAAAALAGAAGARLAAAGALKKFVFVSTAAVYKPSGAPAREDAAVAPGTAVAAACARAEAALRAVAGLPLVVLRPALTYGPGDFTTGLMPRAVIAATYKRTGDAFTQLWDAELRASTVHVFDVARAVVHAARKAPAGGVYNVADKAGSTAGSLARLLGAVFGVQTAFLGSVASNLAALALDATAEAANEAHLGPWLAMLRDAKIANTPLSPVVHKSLLVYAPSNVDGGAIEAATGFKYAVPEPTEELVRDPVVQHIAQGIFPPVL